MSKSRGPEQTPPETTKDLDQSPTHAPEGFGAKDMSPEGLHEQSLGNSERAARLGLGGGDNTPALSDLNVEDWMNEPEASDVEHAPLPYKSELERGFGADLSGVTVRLGAREELDAQGAEATAEGEALSFASTHPDRELVAHEVAHLVQSREHGGSTSGRLSDPNEAAEQEADAAAKTVAEGGQAELKEGVTGVMRKKTKTPKNNSGKTPGGESLKNRWGFKIKVKRGGKVGYQDRFTLNQSAMKYFGDGSEYSGRGNQALQVYINFSMVRRFQAHDGSSFTAVMVHADKTGGNFFVDIDDIQPPQGIVGNLSFKERIHEQCRVNSQPRPKKETGKGRTGVQVNSRLRTLKKDLDALGIMDGRDAPADRQVFIYKGANAKPAGTKSGNLLTDYVAFRKTTQVYLNMNLPPEKVAPIVGNVISEQSLRSSKKRPKGPRFTVRAARQTGLYHWKWAGPVKGKKRPANERWGTASWRYLETTINGNPIRGWVLWDVKKRK